MKALLFFLFFSSLHVFGQTPALNDSVYKFSYLYSSKSSIQEINTKIELPVAMEIVFDITTNGILYLIQPRIISANVAGSKVESNDSSEDDILVDRSSKTVFILSEKRSARYDSAQQLVFIPDTSNRITQMDKLGKTYFYNLNNELDSTITPFPHYPLFEKGIADIKTDKGTWKLMKIEKVDYNFTKLVIDVKSFTPSKEYFVFPF